jgi:hypothetical protein
MITDREEWQLHRRIGGEHDVCWPSSHSICFQTEIHLGGEAWVQFGNALRVLQVRIGGAWGLQVS